MRLRARRRVEHRQVQVFQARRALAFEAHVVKILVHQAELLVHAQVQDRFGIGAISGRRSAARGAIAKLDDAVAALVAGARVHAVAFHQCHAGKVVGGKAVVVRHLQNFVVNSGFFGRRNKALGYRAVQGLLQDRMGGARYRDCGAGFGHGLGRRAELGRAHVVAQGRVAQGCGYGRGRGFTRNRGCGCCACYGCGGGNRRLKGRCNALHRRIGPQQRRGLQTLQIGVDGRQRDVLARIHQVGVANAVGTCQLLGQAHFLVAAELHAARLGLVAHQANQGVARGNGNGVTVLLGASGGRCTFALRLLQNLRKSLGAAADTTCTATATGACGHRRSGACCGQKRCGGVGLGCVRGPHGLFKLAWVGQSNAC